MSSFLGQTLSSLIVGTSDFDCHRVALRLMSKKNKKYIRVKSSSKFVSVIDNPDHFRNRFNPLQLRVYIQSIF